MPRASTARIRSGSAPPEEGGAMLAAAQVSRIAAYQERLRDWSTDDLARFADLLLRYNAAEAAPAARRD
ncbi:hypothetical protein ACGFMM_09810 [Streptomyces sp. NPDC048604]|uniref:hypothetical protein n=1 Tax=Streptomyces sp. NPDC048604 TaxID=3365578 RepID=UPI003717CBBE